VHDVQNRADLDGDVASILSGELQGGKSATDHPDCS